MNLTMRKKIIGLSILSVVVPVVIIYFLILEFQGMTTQKAETELSQVSMQYIAQIARDVYGLCEITNNLVQEKIDNDLNILRKIIDEKGEIRYGPETIEWDAVNQFNNTVQRVRLPKMYIGRTWFGNSDDLRTHMPVVDEVKELVGGTCTIFQKMNERGDMLRIATNVENLDNTRAIGTFIPAVNPDGTPNQVVTTVLNGQIYRGAAYVVNSWYLTAYEPIRDGDGEITGVLYVGEKLEAVQALREAIMNVFVGKTGYVYVLKGTGDDRGSYIISKDGERDGENIWNSTDAKGNYFIQSIVRNALSLKKGDVYYERYPWKNIGEKKERYKIAAITYFKPWDWIIGVGMYEEDYYQAKHELETATTKLLTNLIIGGIITISLAALFAYFIGDRMVRPLDVIIKVAKKIAAGDVQGAREELSSSTPAKSERKRSRFIVSDYDEAVQLLEAFDTMTRNLNSLIGQVHRSGIQVTTSATEISASVKQLQATVSEQAASTKEVMATSREIAATAVDLAQSMDSVSESIDDTANKADTGRMNLNNMESVMKRLVDATSKISSKLAVISEKTKKISSVSTTISKISDQTHLLSLNAAIEAEKAGEYGKGFSVVAQEISRLADQTSIATKDIEYMVKEMLASVSSGVMEMDTFTEEVRGGVQELETIGAQFGSIIEQVRSMVPRFETAKEGMHGQEEGAHQISEAISQLSDTAEQTKQSLHEFKLAIDQLNEAVQGLQKEVTQFKISS